jgi:nucleoside-diphosphate-sugar epimerase
MKYLVTGAAGFIGFHVARALRDGHQVVGIDNLNDYYEVSLKEARLARLGLPGFRFERSISPIGSPWPSCSPASRAGDPPGAQAGVPP